ncbi:MAG: MAPEG family protein [Pseudomonadota bacterium]
MSGALPLVTALYAALLALLAVALGAWVVTLRVRHRVGLGDGGQSRLTRAIRAHGNLLETAPLALLLLLLAELTAALPVVGLQATGLALLCGRLLHAAGLARSGGASPPRFVGMLLTWLVTVALAGALLLRWLRA